MYIIYNIGVLVKYICLKRDILFHEKDAFVFQESEPVIRPKTLIFEYFSILMQGNLNLASTLLEHINIALTFYLQNIHTLHFVSSNVNVLSSVNKEPKHFSSNSSRSTNSSL